MEAELSRADEDEKSSGPVAKFGELLRFAEQELADLDAVPPRASGGLVSWSSHAPWWGTRCR